MANAFPEAPNAQSSPLPGHFPFDPTTLRSNESAGDPTVQQRLEPAVDSSGQHPFETSSAASGQHPFETSSAASGQHPFGTSSAPSICEPVESAIDHSTDPSIVPLVEMPAPYEALSDGELHAKVRRLTAHSNIALADLLVHLGEVERRGIHRERACASLYTYLVYELRMSEDAAYRRAKAARIVREHPDLRDVIARGELHLTGLLMVAPYLGGERHAEVLARARFRTKREISRLVAELDPKAPVAPRIVPLAPALPRRARNIQEALAGYYRILPEGDRPADWIGPADAAAMSSCGSGRMATNDGGALRTAKDDAETKSVDGASGTAAANGASGTMAASCDTADDALTAAEEALAGAWDVRRGAPPDRPLNYEVRFTASQEYVDLLDEALGLLGGPRSASRLPDVQLRALRELVERLRKKKRGAASAPGRGSETKRETNDEPRPAPGRGSEAKRETNDEPRPAPARGSETESETNDAARPALEKRSDTERKRSDATRAETKQSSDDLSDAPRPAPERDQPADEWEVPRPEDDTAGTRYITAETRGLVWDRDGSRCAYVDERGRRCEETHWLEVHHRRAYAQGGSNADGNLELRCRAHNDLAAEHDFGRAHMDRMRDKNVE
jgi:hypothetical protein